MGRCIRRVDGDASLLSNFSTIAPNAGRTHSSLSLAEPKYTPLCDISVDFGDQRRQVLKELPGIVKPSNTTPIDVKGADQDCRYATSIRKTDIDDLLT